MLKANRQILKTLVISFMLMPKPAQAQEQMVLLPRALAVAVAHWMVHPDPDTAIELYNTLGNCINDNPDNGVLVRSGPDECPAVTAALAAKPKGP